MILLKNMVTNKLNILFLIIIPVSFFYGFYLSEDSSGGGQIDYNHILNNYKLIFKNKFSEIDWGLYESSRFPLMYFFFKTYLPFKIEFLKINIFVVSILSSIILYFALKQKFFFLKEKRNFFFYILSSYILLLSPYFRTSAYWLLEENFGFLFIISASFFLYCSFNKNSKFIYFYIFLTIFFSYIAFYSSQNLYYFVIANFVLFIREFGFTSKKTLFVIFLNIILFSPLIIFHKFFLTTLTSAISVGRFSIDLFNIVDIGCIIFIYIIPIYFLFIKHNENFLKKIKKNLIKYLIFILLFILFFFQYQTETTGGGALQKFLLFIFDDSFQFKIIYLFSSSLSYLFILEVLKKEKIFFVFIFCNLFLYIFIENIYQEYFDPSLLLFFFLYFNKIEFLLNIKIKILNVYLILFLTGANVYYIYLQ